MFPGHISVRHQQIIVDTNEMEAFSLFHQAFSYHKAQKVLISFMFSKAVKTVLMFHFPTLILIAAFDGHF